MLGHRRFLSLAAVLLILAIMSGCSGKVPQNGPGALNIAQFTLQDGAINVSYRQLLVASGGLQPYTWTIPSGSLPPGLTLTTDGIISGTPSADPTQYPTSSCQGTGNPPQFPITCNFTIEVTDSQSPTKAVDMAPKSITINPDLVFTSNSLANGTVGVHYAVLTGIQASFGVAPYFYTVVSGNLPDGLTLMTEPPMNNMPNGATISGTPTAAGVFTFTVQATDSVNETATATFAITIVGRLQGPYALTFSGFDTSQPAGSQAFYMTGLLTASADMNGTGVITGIIDQNGPGGSISTAVPIDPGGTYSIPTTSDIGTITFTANNVTYNFQVLVSNTADSKLMMIDPNNPAVKWGSGLLKPQTSTTITITGSSAIYAFGLFGNNNGNRFAGAGAFGVTSTLSVLGGAEDTNDNGTWSQEQAITAGSLSAPDNTGRGTLALTTAQGTFNYIYYIVSLTELVAIENDPSGPATLMDIQQQAMAGLSGGGPALCKQGETCQGVFELDGLSTSGAPEAELGVGTFQACTGSPCSGTMMRSSDSLAAYYLDQNIGGTLGSVSYPNGTYTIDATCGPLASACGRVTVNLNGATNQPVWYLISQTQAFVVGTDPDVTQGTLQPQTGEPFNVSSLLGSYLGGTLTPVSPNITNALEVVSTPPPGGIWTVTFDTSGPTGQQNGVVLSQPYQIDPTLPSGCNDPSTCSYGAAFGKFEVTNSSPSPQALEILYLVGGTAGATGSKAGVVGMNVGVLNGDGTVSPDPNPRLSTYGR